MLSKDQENALLMVDVFLRDPDTSELVIAGHSGSGKTYLTKEILRTINKLDQTKDLLLGLKPNFDIHLTASTNKAAKVLGNTLDMEAGTIHSLLGLRVTNDFKTGKQLLKKSADSTIISNSLIILDEASMIDSALLKVIRESTLKCKVIYIGDPYQLAPVFEADSPVFKEIPNKVELTTVMRQAEHNPIVALGEAFRNTVITGEFPSIIADGVNIILAKGDEFQNRINKAFIASNGENDVTKVVTWRNERVHQYNSYIREMLGAPEEIIEGEFLVANNPISFKNAIAYRTDQIALVTAASPGEAHEIEGYHLVLDYKCKVFLATHQYKVKEKMKKAAKLKDWPEYFRLKEFFVDLRPIHSSTIHKCQGSTYNSVFIDLEDIGKCHNANEVARMLYVAITRASNTVVLFGNLPKKYGGK